jgi:hypothetical protein
MARAPLSAGTFFEFWVRVSDPLDEPYLLASVRQGMVVDEFFAHLHACYPALAPDAHVGVDLRARSRGVSPGYDIFIDRRRFTTPGALYELLENLTDFFRVLRLPLYLELPRGAYAPIENIALERDMFRAPGAASVATANGLLLAQTLERSYVADCTANIQFLGPQTARRIVREQVWPHVLLRERAGWITEPGKRFFDEIVRPHLPASAPEEPEDAPTEPVDTRLEGLFTTDLARHSAAFNPDPFDLGRSPASEQSRRDAIRQNAARVRESLQRMPLQQQPQSAFARLQYQSRSPVGNFDGRYDVDVDPGFGVAADDGRRDTRAMEAIAARLSGEDPHVQRTEEGIPLAWIEQDAAAWASMASKVKSPPRPSAAPQPSQPPAQAAHPTTQTAAWRAFVPLHPIRADDVRCAKCANRRAITRAQPCGHHGYCGECYQDTLGTVYENNCRVCLQNVGAVAHVIEGDEAQAEVDAPAAHAMEEEDALAWAVHAAEAGSDAGSDAEPIDLDAYFDPAAMDA